MSALKEFLDEIQNTDKARVEDVNGKRVLYVTMREFRIHMAAISNLLYYNTEVDYAIMTNHGRPKLELHPPNKK